MNGPHTWEGNYAAREACNKLPPADHSNLQEDRRRGEALLAQYTEAGQQWVEKTGRQLPSREEIVKLQWKRARKHVDQEARASLKGPSEDRARSAERSGRESHQGLWVRIWLKSEPNMP
jgi:hypothetical protein